MVQRWVYRRCSSRHGPLSLEELRAAAFLGFLQPDDLVRATGTEHWVPAWSIEPLLSAFPFRQTVPGAASPPESEDPR